MSHCFQGSVDKGLFATEWSRPQTASDAELVAAAVSHAVGDVGVDFDESVRGLGAAVAGAVGAEVAHERLAPLLQGEA